MNILLVFNPQAGFGRAGKMLPKVRSAFERLGWDVTWLVTQHPGHARDFVADTDLSHYAGVIAGGGDGTLFEVVNGLFRNPTGPNLPIGILPVGTGNSFFRDMELPDASWRSALDVIRAGHRRRVDVGRFQTQGETYYYVNILGFGFVGEVNTLAHKMKFLGNTAYTVGVIIKTIFLTPHQVTLTLDGKTVQRDNLFVEISNSRYTANYLMAPRARMDDGLLDVTLLGAVSRMRLLSCFPKIFNGNHVHMKEIETFQAQSIVVDASVPQILVPDGELLGTTPIAVDCLPQAVELFWP